MQGRDAALKIIWFEQIYRGATCDRGEDQSPRFVIALLRAWNFASLCAHRPPLRRQWQAVKFDRALWNALECALLKLHFLGIGLEIIVFKAILDLIAVGWDFFPNIECEFNWVICISYEKQKSVHFYLRSVNASRRFTFRSTAVYFICLLE